VVTFHASQKLKAAVELSDAWKQGLTRHRKLPPIPGKRYFTIGEVSELCGGQAACAALLGAGVHQLKPVKRRGNRRYYQHHEVLLIRRIRDLLYEDRASPSAVRAEPAWARAHPQHCRRGDQSAFSCVLIAELRAEIELRPIAPLNPAGKK
jgi:hypothetical protein